MSQKALREHNLSVVLRHVLECAEPPSRADIAGATGLTRATVSALVDRLISARMVAELPPATGRVGRPAVPLVPARRTLAAVGLEVNVDYLGARAVDLSGRVVAERTVAADFRRSEPHAVLGQVVALAAEVIAELDRAGVAVVGVCLALPGLVDGAHGPLRMAPNLGWRDVDLTAFFRQPPLDRQPARAANEANLAARAELRRRRGEVSSFLYVSADVGIGAALVSDGDVFLGQHGWSGELGHTCVEPRGPRCACGALGCLEQYAGKDALMRAARLPVDSPVQELTDALERGSRLAAAAVRRAGWALGVALGNFVNLVDVPQVVLGGIYVELANQLVPHVLDELRTRVLSRPWTDVTVEVSRTGQDAAMLGAAMTLLTEIVDDPAAFGAA